MKYFLTSLGAVVGILVFVMWGIFKVSAQAEKYLNIAQKMTNDQAVKLMEQWAREGIIISIAFSVAEYQHKYTMAILPPNLTNSHIITDISFCGCITQAKRIIESGQFKNERFKIAVRKDIPLSGEFFNGN